MQALWMLLASLFFATMGVCIKFASVPSSTASRSSSTAAWWAWSS